MFALSFLNSKTPAAAPALPVPTVEAVMSSFNQTLRDLQEVQRAHGELVREYDSDITQLQLQKASSVAEVAQASIIADKLSALIGA